MKTLIKDGTIVNDGHSFKGGLLIDNDRIAKIFNEKELQEHCIENNVDNTVDVSGLYILPGVIDDQAHFRPPGGEKKATLESESTAAVLGGVTSFMDMPNNNPPATTLEQIEQKFSIARESSHANYSFYLGATNQNIEQIRHADRNRICGIKLFMGSSTGNMLVDDPSALERIFAESPMLIAAHCEDENIIRQNLDRYKALYGDAIPFDAHPEIRSREACIECSRRAIDYAIRHNSRLHILHISTAEEIEMLRAAHTINSKITGEICAHYLIFSKEDYAHMGSRIKCNPAIKQAGDRDALRKAIKEGLIKVVATDHAPHTLEEKSGNYLAAPSGMPTIQHSLQMMIELVEQGIFTLEEVVKVMCHGPADTFGISGRGYIKEGYYADLAIVDLNRKYTVTKENIAYKCKWSPLEGHTFGSSVIYTFINGKMTAKEGVVAEERAAMELRFNRSPQRSV